MNTQVTITQADILPLRGKRIAIAELSSCFKGPLPKCCVVEGTTFTAKPVHITYLDGRIERAPHIGLECEGEIPDANWFPGKEIVPLYEEEP